MTALTSALTMTGPGTFFVPFAKIDAKQRIVYGYASTEARDQQGEIVLRSAIEKALPDYLQWANIREMHQASAVGVAKEASVDTKGFWLGAQVFDDRAWSKVENKVYKGFSIGGQVTERDPNDRSIITALDLTEVSLVDRPANPEASFTIIKRVDGRLMPQPLQKWDCGIAEHQHMTKVDASNCLSEQARQRTQQVAKSEHTGEPSMDPSVADVTEAAKSAITELRSSVSPVAIMVKQVVDHKGAAGTAGEAALIHEKTASDHEEAAAGAHDSARKAVEAGNGTEAMAQHQEGAEHDTAAHQQRNIAQSFHEAHAHHLEKASAQDGVDHGEMADAAQKAHGHHLAMHEKMKKIAAAHTGFAQFHKASGHAHAEAMGAHHDMMAKAYDGHAAAHETLAKRAGGVHGHHAHHASKVATADTNKVVPSASLKKLDDGSGYVRQDGTGWFGKREYSDKQRKEYADQGIAEDDGSYPIPDKGALEDAIHAYGRSSNKAKTKAHIIARAKALGATSMLPEGWADGGGDNKDAAAKGTNMKCEKCAKCGATMAKEAPKCPGCGAEVTKAAASTEGVGSGSGKNQNEATHASNPEAKPNGAAPDASNAGVHDGSGGNQTYGKVRIGSTAKGLGVIAQLAGILEQIKGVYQSSAYEQVLEHEGGSTIADEIGTWFEQGLALLPKVVADEVPEIEEGKDVEVAIPPIADPMAIALAAAVPSNAAILVAKAIRDKIATIAKSADGIKLRSALKRVAEGLEKYGARHSTADMHHIQQIHDHTASLGATCTAGDGKDAAAKIATVIAEKNTVVQTLTQMTETVKTVTRDNKEAKARAEAEKSELTKRIESQTQEIATLKARVTELERLPMPTRSHGMFAGRQGVTKGQDTAAAEEKPRTDITTLPEPARANEIYNRGLSLRYGSGQ